MADIELLEQEPKTGHWISVTDRLPKYTGEYLLWGKVTDDEENNSCFIGDYDACAEVFGFWQWHYSHGKWYYSHETLGFVDSEFQEYASVVAWMPLPKP